MIIVDVPCGEGQIVDGDAILAWLESNVGERIGNLRLNGCYGRGWQNFHVMKGTKPHFAIRCKFKRPEDAIMFKLRWA